MRHLKSDPFGRTIVDRLAVGSLVGKQSIVAPFVHTHTRARTDSGREDAHSPIRMTWVSVSPFPMYASMCVTPFRTRYCRLALVGSTSCAHTRAHAHALLQSLAHTHTHAHAHARAHTHASTHAPDRRRASGHRTWCSGASCVSVSCLVSGVSAAGVGVGAWPGALSSHLSVDSAPTGTEARHPAPGIHTTMRFHSVQVRLP